MSSSDAFALRKTGLDAFLFAEVGTELNGSPLTILSVLARLGNDPWAEAAKLVGMPKSATIDRLTQSIRQMPLTPQALTDARATAARLILLLPSQTSPERPAATNKPKVSQWVLVVISIAAVALGIGFGMMPGKAPSDTVSSLSTPQK
jgi:hypothetical protein